MTTFIGLSALTLSGIEVLLGLAGVTTLLVTLVIGIKTYWKNQHDHYLQESEQLPNLTKKHGAVDVRRHKTHLKLLSLGAAIGIVFIIFAWTHYQYAAFFEGDGLVLEEGLKDVPVTTREPVEPLPPALPPPPESNEIELVEQEPLPVEEPEVEPVVVQTTGPYDGKAAPGSAGDYVIEPEPEPDPEPVEEPEVFDVVEQMPRFPGCEEQEGNHKAKKACADQKLLAFMYDQIRYPNQARELGIEGIAVVSFVVDRKGNIQDIEILRDPGGGLGKEAKRVVKLMNDLPEAWTPGKQRGKEVKVRYNLPVRFTLH